MSFRSRLWALLGFCFPALLLHAEEPFVFEKNPGRLPKTILPQRYEVRIEPDLEHAVFSGDETVSLDVREPVRQIVLHASGLAITEAKLRGAEETPLIPQINADARTLTFDLPSELPPGKYTLALHFAGNLTEQPRGLYIAPYQANGVTRKLLATQMEAVDCRRMFPCWDEPAFRAEFVLTAVVPEKLRAISNMPIVAETPQGDGRRRIVTFAPSPKMASYLVALAIGDFEVVRDEVEGVQLAVYTTPGKREQGRFALESTKKILTFYHEYLGIKYPLPKLDQIAIPSTGAGAMENWGCIIYNDNALLYDPATSAQNMRERVFAVIAHENAHQWFGNLVTMAWWDNLWLNEGFASWMGTKCTDRFNPEWKVWLRAAGSKEFAMHLDARSTTHPIQRPVPDDSHASDGFDEITYNKGQAVLRMIESWLGEDAFRAGIRDYLQTHAYSNTTTADLWASLAKSSGKPVREFAAHWTEQPGFPVVTLSALPTGSQASVQLEQQHFSIHQKDPAPLSWEIPVIYGPAGAPSRALLALLKEPIQPGALLADIAIKANIGDVGYYRVAYDAPLARRLLKAAPLLAEADRLNALNDCWALVQAGRTPPAECLDLMDALSDDRSPTVVQRIVDLLSAVDGLERNTKNRDGFRAWARDFLRPQFDRLSWEARPGESPLDATLRGSLISILGTFGSEEITSSARARFAAYLHDPASLPGDLRGAVFSVVGHDADAMTWEQLHKAARQEDSFEQKRALYSALVAARNPALAGQTLSLSLTNELIASDGARLVQRVAQEGEQQDLAWAFARAHLEALLAKLPDFAANHYVPRIFEGFDDAAHADELEAFARQNLPPVAELGVAQAADNIRFQAEFKARALPEIDAWWQARVRR